jgi:hypothetical protein
VIAQDQDPLWKRLQSRDCIFDALDDDGAGRTAENLFFAVPMHVRVIPVQPGRLIARNLEAIFERSLRGKDPGTQRFVLMACRWNEESVEVQVRRLSGYDTRGAIVRRGRRVMGIGLRGQRYFVFQAEDELISGFEAECRRTVAGVVEIAVSNLLSGREEASEAKVDGEGAVTAAEFVRR